MDAINLLKEQHQEVRALFRQCETAHADKQKQRLVEQICQHLTIHDRLEREVFYPAVIDKPGEKDLVLEGMEEHHLLSILLKQLSTLDPSDETYDAKLTTLQEVFEHHVKEEEGQMFPQAQKAIDQSELLRLGQRMQNETRRLMQREPQVTITMLSEVTLEQTPGLIK